MIKSVEEILVKYPQEPEHVKKNKIMMEIKQTIINFVYDKSRDASCLSVVDTSAKNLQIRK